MAFSQSVENIFLGTEYEYEYIRNVLFNRNEYEYIRK